MKIIDALKALNNYPIPTSTVVNITEEAGLTATNEADAKTRKSNAFKKAKALTYQFLAEAPNISQGGINYSFSQAERDMFAKKASALLDEIGDEEGADFEVGYVGEDF